MVGLFFAPAHLDSWWDTVLLVGKGKLKAVFDDVACGEQTTDCFRTIQVDGWLERKPHETDRRAKRIIILPTGREKYSELRDCAADLQGELLTTLPAERRDAFLEELAKVADACHAAAAEAGRKNRD